MDIKVGPHSFVFLTPHFLATLSFMGLVYRCFNLLDTILSLITAHPLTVF